jgi:sec-independent protein translocase protein TatC
MGFFEHIGELRKRVVRALLGMIPGVALGWVYREELLAILLDPFAQAWSSIRTDQPEINFLNPIDPFVAYMKIALIAGLCLGAPWVFWQLWAFIAPGLYRREKRLALPFVMVATIFFCGGIAFGYLAVFPMAFRYFLEFSVVLPNNITVDPEIAIDQILTFEIRMLLAFGLVFELPVITTFLAAAGIVTWKQLLKFSRWWILIASILSAILTPPDVGSQLMMLVPLVVLYFISILLAMFFKPKKRGDEPGEGERAQ